MRADIQVDNINLLRSKTESELSFRREREQAEVNKQKLTPEYNRNMAIQLLENAEIVKDGAEYSV